jgi:hypothetical protein
MVCVVLYFVSFVKDFTKTKMFLKTNVKMSLHTAPLHTYYIMTQDSRLDPFTFIRVLQAPKIDHDTTISAIFHDYNLLIPALS